MKALELCPLCGGDLETRRVEKLLKGGSNMLALAVTAEVCGRCGEHLYTPDMATSFDKIRDKLRKNEFSHFKPLGQSFTVEEGWPNNSIHPVT